MSRQGTGRVIVRERQDGRVYALRFTAYGERRYVTLGSDADGWDRQRAGVELQNVLADVRRKTWRPPTPAPAPKPADDPTFHVFASEWWAAKRNAVSPNTRVDYEWQLSNHLLPFFAEHRLKQITVAEVDRYRNHKVTEGQLSAASINKTLTRLGQILDQALEYELIEKNPLRVNNRNRRLKISRPAAVWLDRADQIQALLSAAGELDTQARPDRRHVPRQALLATLVFAGLRLGELLALRWRHVDLAAGRLYVADAKTAVGVRHVELLPALRDVLVTYKLGTTATGPDDLVFATSNGHRFSRDNVRNRVFARAVGVANARRLEADLTPLPEGLSPHKLRHTACSLMFVCGYELPRVMRELGHADSAVTLRIYAHVMSTEPGERERLRALVDGQLLIGEKTNGLENSPRPIGTGIGTSGTQSP